jgi:hypothetical protein
MVPRPEAGGPGAGPRDRQAGACDPASARPPDTTAPPPGSATARRSLHETAELALQRVHERVGRVSAAGRRPDVGPLFERTEQDPETSADPPAPAEPQVPADPEVPAADLPAGADPSSGVGSRSEPDPSPDPEGPAASGTPLGPDEPSERFRVIIRGLVVRRGGSRVQVVATLAFGERAGSGTAEVPATRSGLWLGVGEATLEALDELVGPDLQVGIDRITVASHEEPPSVRVLLTALFGAGEETLLGATLLHDDPVQAVMRATLDALNCRIEPLLRTARLAAATR